MKKRSKLNIILQQKKEQIFVIQLISAVLYSADVLNKVRHPYK